MNKTKVSIIFRQHIKEFLSPNTSQNQIIQVASISTLLSTYLHHLHWQDHNHIHLYVTSSPTFRQLVPQPFDLAPISTMQPTQHRNSQFHSLVCKEWQVETPFSSLICIQGHVLLYKTLTGVCHGVWS